LGESISPQWFRSPIDQPQLGTQKYGRSTNGGLLLGSFIGIALGLGLEVQRHALAGGGWVDFVILVGGQYVLIVNLSTMEMG